MARIGRVARLKAMGGKGKQPAAPIRGTLPKIDEQPDTKAVRARLGLEGS